MDWSAVDYCDVFISCLELSFWRHPFTSIAKTFECCGLLWCFYFDGTLSHPLLRHSSAVDFFDVLFWRHPFTSIAETFECCGFFFVFLFWRHPFTSIAETFECCGLFWCFYSDGIHSHPLLRHSSAVDYCDVFILTAPSHSDNVFTSCCTAVMFLLWRHPFTSIAETFECYGLLWCFYSDGTHSLHT